MAAVRALAIGNMYPPHSLGGYEVIWRSSVTYLRSAGHAVRVLTTDYRLPAEVSPDEPDVHRELRWYWRDHDFPRLGLLTRVRLECRNAAVLRRHLADHRPDVVCWWAMGGMSLSLIEQVRRAGIPTIGVVCDDWMLYGPRVDAWLRPLLPRPRLGSLAERLTGVPATLNLSASARWLFISEHTRRRALGAHADLERTGIANAGVDPELFPPAPEEPWRGELLYAGRLDERKGVETAVESLCSLPTDTHLRVVGGGDVAYAARLTELAERSGLRERVRFEQPRPRHELAAVYAEADVLLFPVRWAEPWGLAPLEAMAVGTPVIATGTGGSGEYLRDGENCLLVPADDPPALAGAVRRLRFDPDLRGQLRRAGLETAARFTERACNSVIETALVQAALRRGG